MANVKTLREIEALLDSGRLEAEMPNGNFWAIRRNGATKTWKTRPGEFRIPIKAGLRSHGYLDNNDLDAMAIRVKAD